MQSFFISRDLLLVPPTLGFVAVQICALHWNGSCFTMQFPTPRHLSRPAAVQVSQLMLFNMWICLKVLWSCRWAAARGALTQQRSGLGMHFPLESKKSSGFWCLLCCLISVLGTGHKMCRDPLWFIPCVGAFELYHLRAETFLT